MFAVAVAVDVALQLCFSLLLHLRGGADSKGKGSKGLFKSNSRVPRCHGGVQRGQVRLLRVLIAITRDVVVEISSIANRFNGRRHHLRAIAVTRSRELRRRFGRSCARRAAAFTATSLRRLLSLEVGLAAFACDPLGEGNHQRILAPVVGGQAVRKAVASLRPRRRRGPAPPSATAAALKAQSAASRVGACREGLGGPSARSAPHAAA